MEKCAICNSELKFINTPLLNKGKLSTGATICTSCLKKVNRVSPSIANSINKFDPNKIIELINKNKEKANKSPAPKIIASIVVVGFLIFGIKSCFETNTIESTVTSKSFISDTSNMKNCAYSYIQLKVKDRLKAPGSADFPLVNYNDLVQQKDSMFYVNSYVDAQNSFGALLRSSYIASAKYLGGNPDSSQNWHVEVLLEDDLKELMK